MTITLQALSLVRNAKPCQVRFTLRSRDQRSMWRQDGCKVYMDYYTASNGACFMVTWDFYQKPPLGGRPYTKPWKAALQMLTTVDLPYFIMCEDMHENKFIQNNCWSRAWSHTTSQYTWVTTQNDFGGVLWRPLSHFHLGSHNSMGTALGLRWSDPLGPLHTQAWRPMTIAI